MAKQWLDFIEKQKNRFEGAASVTDRQTDRWTDGKTDRQSQRQKIIDS